MESFNHSHATRAESSDFLAVEPFVADMASARALSTALEMGVIDLLARSGQITLSQLCQEISFEPNCVKLLLGLLLAGDVIRCSDGEYLLTENFVKVYPYRDLLVAKLDFAHIAAHDFIDLFSYMISDVRTFRKRSGMFRLFNYSNSVQETAENFDQTMRWMRITTVLTRYEARACIMNHNLSVYRSLLDVGGNSGEFSLQACRHNPTLRATVFDLPVVCEVGQQHVSHEPEAERITFVKGNALTEALPVGHDLITFKSVLHDWPDKEAMIFLSQAATALPQGGTILIYERGPFEIGPGGLPYSQIPLMLFSHTFRSPEWYCTYLESRGFGSFSVTWITLDMPFFIVTAVKE